MLQRAIVPRQTLGSSALAWVRSSELEEIRHFPSWTRGATADRINTLGKSVCGVFMAKSLLILMLMTTQLLAGSGGSVYLCISNDGSYCCFDTGPESCMCCHEEQEEIVHDPCCGGCQEDGNQTPCGHHEEEQAISLTTTASLWVIRADAPTFLS